MEHKEMLAYLPSLKSLFCHAIPPSFSHPPLFPLPHSSHQSMVAMEQKKMLGELPSDQVSLLPFYLLPPLPLSCPHQSMVAMEQKEMLEELAASVQTTV
ncbi:unnamed protein product [Closterium sp. NIES-54]